MNLQARLQNKLKRYDKYLRVKKLLDGETIIYRQSPYSNRIYKVFSIINQFIGSGDWVLRKIALMDSQRWDIAGQVERNNVKLKKKRSDDRITREVAELLTNNELITI